MCYIICNHVSPYPKVLSVVTVVYHFPQAHERLEDVKLEAVRNNNVELVSEILSDISGLAEHNDSAAELSKILKEPHFQVTMTLILVIFTNS